MARRKKGWNTVCVRQGTVGGAKKKGLTKIASGEETADMVRGMGFQYGRAAKAEKKFPTCYSTLAGQEGREYWSSKKLVCSTKKKPKNSDPVFRCKRVSRMPRGEEDWFSH